MTNGSLAGFYRRPGQTGKTIDGEPDETQEELWQRLRSLALKDDPSFFGYDGAVARFQSIFPNGFKDPLYLDQERNYKVEARDTLNERVPVRDAAAGVVSIDCVVAAFESTT